MISSFQRIHHFCGFDICGCLFILTYFLFNFSRMPVAWISCCSFCPNSWNISLLVCQDETTFISLHGSFSLSFVLYYFLFSLYWKRSFIVAAVARIFLLSRLGFIVAPNVFTIFITNLAIFAAAFFLVWWIRLGSGIILIVHLSCALWAMSFNVGRFEFTS